MKPTLRIIALLLVGLSLVCPAAEPSKAVVRFQYRSGDIAIPAATANEPRVESFGADSLRLAARYLDEGALAWTRERSCMACHTTGVYLAERPALTQFFGPPLQEVRASFIAEVPVDPTAAEPHGFLVWRALGLAKWDEHVAETVSEPTDRALRHMLRRLPEDGLFDTVSKVEIPYTTTEFELTVQAARALAAAPGWLAGLTDPELAERVARLQAALAAHRPRNDYERVLQLQLATIMPELVPQATRDAAITMLRGKQHPDGGWSTRDLSAVENWGSNPPRQHRNAAGRAGRRSPNERCLPYGIRHHPVARKQCPGHRPGNPTRTQLVEGRTTCQRSLVDEVALQTDSTLLNLHRHRTRPASFRPMRRPSPCTDDFPSVH